MRLCSETDTIAAIATPPGAGGVGVVRVSGPGAKRVLGSLWDGSTPVARFVTHRQYYGAIVRDGSVIDRVLATWMRAPRSYTGEDVVEISGHGGAAVMEALLDACCEKGARVAEPGEFTRRAFMGGRMDLAQAEAVADIIAATSRESLMQAQRQLGGMLSNEIASMQDDIASIRALVEASIDFPEEDESFMEAEQVAERLSHIASRMRRLADSYDRGRFIREGVCAVIAGRPNAGKSSLFNALAGDERAIVHDVPGTTRDVIAETVVIEGRTIHLHDTAGLNDTGDAVERMGVDRSRAELSQADIVIYVIDGSVGMHAEDRAALSAIPSDKTVVVYNKRDLCQLGARPPSGVVSVSAKTDEGLDELRAALVEKTTTDARCGDAEGVVITNARHHEALIAGCDATERASRGLAQRTPLECIAQDLRGAHESLGRIRGEGAAENVLERIFSRFCIGK